MVVQMSTPEFRAPRGTTLHCKNWLIEAAFRMIQNNLDPEVAEDPANLIVYGGSGQAARNHEALDGLLQTLQRLEPDETMLVQSGKCVAVFRTHEDAPRVLIANSNLVGDWANWDEFRRLQAEGLTMYGQMTAGSWIYIASQGIVQGTYETFVAAGRRHFGGTLAGKLTVTAGLGGMGGAQPLAVTMAGGVCLAADVEAARIQKRLDSGYLDQLAGSIDEAIGVAQSRAAAGEAWSVAVVCNATELLDILLERQIVPDLLTDQTSAHDPLYGYIPVGMTIDEAKVLRESSPDEYVRRATESMTVHVQAMLDWQEKGAIVFDYGNNLRQRAYDNGLQAAFNYPGFVPAYIRPLFCEGKGPFRWVALSGNPEDIYTTDRAVIDLFPENDHLKHWITMAQQKVEFQGLPARICWLGYGERVKAGLKFNELVASGQVKAPIVIGRDHLDCGSVASPNRETEGMKDGSDAIADWAILNALVNTASGATWVSFHHGGGVGIGYSLHAGQVIVADGTPEAARRLERVLTADPGLGVARHVDAGYEEAVNVAKERGVKIPMMK